VHECIGEGHHCYALHSHPAVAFDGDAHGAGWATQHLQPQQGQDSGILK
jgi:hypothetical protein